MLAVPFDTNGLTVTGSPVPVIENFAEISTDTAGQFSVSLNGTLAFRPGAFAGVRRTFVWVDREGHEQPIPANPRAYEYPRLSPDGTKIAVSSADEENDIWVFDLKKEILTRLTFGPAFELYAAWTPDNRYLLFSSGPFGSGTGGHVDIFRKAADGTGGMETLTQNLGGGYPQSISPDGKSLVFRKQLPSMGLFLLPLDPKSEAHPMLTDPKFGQNNGEISPDGRWLAYQSNESGRFEIYVRPFPAVDSGRWQISSEGGTKPLWSRSGRELFFATDTNRIASVPVAAGSAFSYGKPQVLFDAAAYLFSTASGRSFDISPDGKRFLMIKPVNSGSAAPRPSIVIVTNWFDEVKARMPGK
jgi:serine/threonine-protein kinase